ncbi:hypothetical protein D1007_57481 [Hordeum vulgare]|nr:hypothetical protein D1007_57481 [Hordeum vulgare]
MIIKELLGHRITPLQAHSRPFWGFTIDGDPMCLHISGQTHDELDVALGSLLGPYPEDLPRATPPLYACDDMQGMVVQIPSFDEWEIVEPHKGSIIAVSSLGKERSNQYSEATEGEEEVGRILLPDLHSSLRSLGDDTAMDER